MGRPVATASNIGQGWRKAPKWTAADYRQAGINPSGEVQTSKEPEMHSKVPEGKCGGASWQKSNKSNKYRAKNDDGGRKHRRPSGGMDNKHRSPLVS